MTLTEYRRNVPPRQQAIIRPDAANWWYAELSDYHPWRDVNGNIITRQSAAALYTYLQYNGFSPRYEWSEVL
jgi:hypothetical protein